MKNFQLAVTMLAILISLGSFAQQAGDLDPTFGNNGIALIDIDNLDDVSYSSLVQPDGKIILGGTSVDGSLFSMSLVRLNPDGTPDVNFSGDGKLIIPLAGDSEHGDELLLQNEKIIIAGYSDDNGYPKNFVMNRINPNGAIDNTFGNGGRIITDFSGNNSQDVANTGIIVKDKILLAGGSNESGSNNMFALARYNFDGSLDNSFGTGGKVTTDFGTERDFINDIAVQSDGKIIAVGLTQPISFYWALARYNQDGTLDNTFGTNGKVTQSWGGSYDRLDAVAILPNDNFLVAGRAGDFSSIARYNNDGTLDNTFGDEGKTEIPGVNPSIIVYGNKIFAATSLNGFNGFDFLLTRLEYDGQLDNTFGNGGTLSTTISSGDDLARDIKIQPDGKILLAGNSGLPSNYAAVRCLNDPFQPNFPFFIIDGLSNQGFINFSELGNPAVTAVNAIAISDSILAEPFKDSFVASGVASRFYDVSVTPQNAGTISSYNASLRLYYSDLDIQGINENNLKLVRLTNDGWIYVGGTVNTTENYVEANNVHEVGIFTFADPDSITNVNTEGLVNEFKLAQNYPNPFNPSTTISWQSPVGSHQTIKIYDLLGNEIAILVDEYKHAGTYNIEFNASRFASGVYLYRLQANDFVATKKLLLIK